MGQFLSTDLRSRLMAAIDDGISCRVTAARLERNPIKWTPFFEKIARLNKNLGTFNGAA